MSGIETPPFAVNPIFFLDYDGTLAPLTEHPMSAYPYPDVPALLARLDELHPLWIVTGRHLRDLVVLLGMPLRAIGLHGVQEGRIGGAVTSQMPEEARIAVEALRITVPEIKGTWVEDKEHTFTVHYRGGDGEAATRAVLREWLSELPDSLHAIWGKEIVEPRPIGISKGVTVSRIAAGHGGRTPVYIGDDTTDEDAFKALDGQAVTIKVGQGETAARYRLAGPEEVVTYLRQYLE